MTLGKRVEARRIAMGMSQAELALRIGGNTKQQNIAQLEGDEVRQPRYLHKLLKVLNMSYEEAVEGKNKDKNDKNLNYANVRVAPDIEGHVPIISWVKAGEWTEAEDNFQPGDGEGTVACHVKHSKHTFALRVKGDSMTSPAGRSYPEGTLIIVDPDQRGGITTGDRVIAKVNGEPDVTFKCFVEDGGKRFLKPLNPQYPIITEEFRIIGKVLGGWLD